MNSTQRITSLVSLIKHKPELRGLADTVVKQELENYIARENINLSAVHEKDYFLIVKAVRARLRQMVGRFHHRDVRSRKHFSNSSEFISAHSSTLERSQLYSLIAKSIAELKVHSILDLGCGNNPLVFASFFPNCKYYAVDIDESSLKLVHEFFKRNKISGNTYLQDIRQGVSSLPDADLCLLWKLLDVIEKNGHKLAEDLIKELKNKCTWLMISFSTKTLSGKPMNHPQRGWIERLLHRLGFSFKIIKTKNEIFYLASASQRITGIKDSRAQ